MEEDIFFVLSKMFWGMATPASLLSLVVCIVLLFYLYGKGTCVRKLSIGLIVLLVVLLILPIGDWILHPWEKEFPPIELPKKVDGIVILGAAVDPVQTAAFGQISINSHAERIAVVPLLVRKYPKAKVIYAGGSGYVRHQDKKEADVAKELLQQWNVPLKNFVFERESRNTWENALNAKALARPEPGQTWLLVTSAVHMKRSKAIFDQIHWKMTPYPVDYSGLPHPDILCFCADDNIYKIKGLMHEVIGIAIYRFTGRAR